MSIVANLETFFDRVFTFNQQKFDALIVQIQNGFAVAEHDLGVALAWFNANAPTILSDATALVSVAAGLTGNLAISPAVIKGLETALADLGQLITAVKSVQGATPAAAYDVMMAYGGSNTKEVVRSAYALHNATVAAAAQVREALANAHKK